MYSNTNPNAQSQADSRGISLEQYLEYPYAPKVKYNFYKSKSDKLAINEARSEFNKRMQRKHGRNWKKYMFYRETSFPLQSLQALGTVRGTNILNHLLNEREK